MSGDERFCPVCERRMPGEVCPDDGIPTVEAATVSDDPRPVGPGTVIAGRYRIDGVLGEGGMGTVYLATQQGFGRPVALKILLRHLMAEPRILRRFYQEAQTASVLDHPNIVRLYEFGFDGACRVPFLAMELLEGLTLKALLLEGGAMPERRAAGILAQVAKALVEAHEKRVIHRDLKTENVMVRTLPDGDEHVKVLDFGIAKILAAEGAQEVNLTLAGEALGTPATMSPEQIRGEPVDFRTDLYALGCILHTVLCGHPPFTAEERMMVLYKHLHEAPPALPGMLIDGAPPSADLVALHAALLTKPKTGRPASTSVVARILGGLARGENPGAAALLDGAQRAGGGPRRATVSGPAARVPERTPTGKTPAGVARTGRTPLGSRAAAVEGTQILRTPTPGGRNAMQSLPADHTLIDADLAGLEPKRVKRRTIVAFAVLGVVAVALGGLAWWTSREPGAAQAAIAPAPASALAVATPSPDPAPTPAAAPAPAADAPSAPSVVLRSDPPGAAVLRDGSEAGRTPFTLRVPDAGVDLRLRLSGYADAVVRVDARSPSEQMVRLVPQVKDSVASSRPGNRPGRPAPPRPANPAQTPAPKPPGGVPVW